MVGPLRKFLHASCSSVLFTSSKLVFACMKLTRSVGRQVKKKNFNCFSTTSQCFRVGNANVACRMHSKCVHFIDPTFSTVQIRFNDHCNRSVSCINLWTSQEPWCQWRRRSTEKKIQMEIKIIFEEDCQFCNCKLRLTIVLKTQHSFVEKTRSCTMCPERLAVFFLWILHRSVLEWLTWLTVVPFCHQLCNKTKICCAGQKRLAVMWLTALFASKFGAFVKKHANTDAVQSRFKIGADVMPRNAVNLLWTSIQNLSWTEPHKKNFHKMTEKPCQFLCSSAKRIWRASKSDPWAQQNLCHNVLQKWTGHAGHRQHSKNVCSQLSFICHVFVHLMIANANNATMLKENGLNLCSILNLSLCPMSKGKMINEESSEIWLIVCSCRDCSLRFSSEVAVRCAKSCMPFECFGNENHKLQNQAKMNVMFETGSAPDLSAQSSLCWDERCFCMKNQRASCVDCHSLGNDSLTMMASCQMIQNKCAFRESVPCEDALCAANHRQIGALQRHTMMWAVLLCTDINVHFAQKTHLANWNQGCIHSLPIVENKNFLSAALLAKGTMVIRAFLPHTQVVRRRMNAISRTTTVTEMTELLNSSPLGWMQHASCPVTRNLHLQDWAIPTNPEEFVMFLIKTQQRDNPDAMVLYTVAWHHCSLCALHARTHIHNWFQPNWILLIHLSQHCNFLNNVKWTKQSKSKSATTVQNETANNALSITVNDDKSNNSHPLPSSTVPGPRLPHSTQRSDSCIRPWQSVHWQFCLPSWLKCVQFSLADVKEQALQLLHDKVELGVLSDKAGSFTKQTIESKATPSPKLLIEDHKNPDNEGNFPTGQAVPATNFTSAFPKTGYLGIKRIPDGIEADCMSKTTIQASDLKENCQNQGMTCNNSTTASKDAEDFHPSARLKLVRKAVCHFSKDLPKEDQITIEHCLDLIKFGMQSTLLAFVDKCHECDSDGDPEEKGLTIGGCESAWLADLVGACILDNTKSHFRKTKCYELHRDDGIAAFNNKLSCGDMLEWRTKFQNSVNRLAGGNCLQFTCSMWLDKSRRELPTEQNDPKMSVETGNFFQCLDTELVWATNGNLQFWVHLEPNQQLKHPNADGIHTKACFKAIPSGVYKTLSELTKITETNKNLPLDKIYPQHFQALQHAGLVTKKVPTLTEQLLHNEEAKAAEQAEDNSNNERNRRRTACFCIGHSNIWSKPVHSIIKSTKDKFNLQWLRVSVSHHRFTNLREVFQGDLSRKLTVGLTSQDFEPLPCNCRTSGNGNCGYNNMCRNSTAVCKVKCNKTGKVHIGNTQQKFKNRMQQHFNEVQKLVKLGEKSDSCAKHFATQFCDTNPTPTNQRGGTTCSIIWQGNPISVVKTFAAKNCALCAKERFAILEQSRSNPQLLVNSNNEISGACGHRPRFRGHAKQTTPSTDESINDERASPTHEVVTDFARCNICLVDV